MFQLPEFAQDNGSDVRQVGRSGAYLPVLRRPSYFQQVKTLEAKAAKLKPRNPERKRLVAEAASLRSLLASFKAEVPPVTL